MSCSDHSVFAGLRGRIDRFLATPYYILTAMVLSILSHLLSLELPVYTVFALVWMYTAVLGKDLLPLTPLFLFCYISPSVINNPGRNAQSVFSGSTGAYVAALAVLIALATLWHVIRNRKQFFRTKRVLLPGMLLLASAYLLSGLGSVGYSSVVWRNLLFAAMQVAALVIPYLLLTGGVDWNDARRDYLAWVGFSAGVAVLLQVLSCYLTQNVVVDGVIMREQIYTGWGMYNNMGLVLDMAIPFAFYLATKYRRGWIGTVVGSVFLVGTLLTCSRTSVLIGFLTYCLCVALMLHYARNRKHNTIALVTVIVAGIAILALFHAPLLRLFSRFLGMGADPSSRDVFFKEGWKLFVQSPIFGNSFYSPGYIPWDFSVVDTLSAVIPPRWHNTLLQILVSCGIAGVCAYGFHRIQTVRLFLKRPGKENTFIGCGVGVLLLCSLLDCHFFNLGPTMFYSAMLAFAERGEQ